ncbi:MAG: MFS transporter [archaeon]|nr:MFS transporter [archaeon]
MMEIDKENKNTTTQKTLRSYLLFWLGQLFSLLGSSISQFIIIWWITITTESSIMLSITNFLYMLPMTIALPIAGVIADRWNRKKILIIADSIQALVMLLIIFLFNLIIVEPLWIMLLLGVLGLLQGFHLPTVNAIVPTMVPKENLSRINGIGFLFTGLIQIVGPMLAATLLLFTPIKLILWLDPITFLIAIIPLIFIKIPSVKNEKLIDKKNSFRGDFMEGFKTLKLIPVVSMMLLVSMFINFLLRPFNVLMPYYLKFIHFGNATNLAFVSLFTNIGMFLGAFITSIKKNWKHSVFIYFGGEIVLMVCMIVFAFSPTGSFFLMGFVMAVFGFTVPILNTIYLTTMQNKVPDDKMGRISSIDFAISFAISPISILLSGFLAEILGIRNLYFYCAIVGIIISLLIWRYASLLNKQKKNEISYSSEI